MMKRNEAVQKLATVGRLSIAHAEDLYDSLFEKPVVKQCVADWIDACKENLAIGLYTAMNPNFLKQWNKSDELICWIKKARNQDIFARAWVDGYEVEKEPRYTVRIKGLSEINRYLNKERDKEFLFADSGESEDYQTKFTRKELEEGGFGEVFDNPMFEVKEVTDE